MQKGMPSKRFICEHQVVPGLDKELVQKMHKTLIEDIKVLYTFSNPGEQRMYSVIESNDTLTVESFFSEIRVPWDVITEVGIQGEGRSKIEDLRAVKKAA